jgi:acetyl esterase/lipase
MHATIHQHKSAPFIAMCLCAFMSLAFWPVAHAQTREFKDVVYAKVDGKSLAVDIYVPQSKTKRPPPLLVWVHGGAWYLYDKKQYPKALVEAGFAVASLDFRQSTEARFPAQIHDIKAGIRFLRSKARDYGYRVDRVAIGGSSSGGHLAAMVGVSNDDPQLEGTLGEYLSTSSKVDAIVDYFGASNLTTILAQSTPYGLSVRQPALDKLLGAQPESVPELAKLASPVLHVDRNDPPLLLLHGDQDPQMPINQSHELQGAYEKLGLDAKLIVVHGAAHAGPIFYEGEQLKAAVEFLRRTIGK